MNTRFPCFLFLSLLWTAQAHAIEVLEMPGEGSVLQQDGLIELNQDEPLDADLKLDREAAISIEFRDEAVRTILLQVASVYDLELIVPESLSGRSSVRLRNVGWHQVYDVLLEPIGYRYLQSGDTVTIMKSEDYAQLPSKAFHYGFFYISASEYVEHIGQYLFNRESVKGYQVNADTNSLTVIIHPGAFNQIKAMVEGADTPRAFARFPKQIYWPERIPEEAFNVEASILNQYSVDELERYETRVFCLNEVSARQLASKLKDMDLKPSSAGSIQVDYRSNCLVVTEQLGALLPLQGVVDFLDRKQWYRKRAELD